MFTFSSVCRTTRAANMKAQYPLFNIQPATSTVQPSSSHQPCSYVFLNENVREAFGRSHSRTALRCRCSRTVANSAPCVSASDQDGGKVGNPEAGLSIFAFFVTFFFLNRFTNRIAKICCCCCCCCACPVSE